MDKLRNAQSRIGTIDPLVQAQVKDTMMLRRYKEQKGKVEKQIDSLQRIMMPGEDIQGIYEDPNQLANQLQSLFFYLDPAFGTPNPPLGAPPSTYGLQLKKVKASADAFNQSVDGFEKGAWKEFEAMIRSLNLQLTAPLDQ